MKSKWIFFILWLVTIFAGAAVSEFVVPARFEYLTGFITGTFSFMFMRLFDDYR